MSKFQTYFEGLTQKELIKEIKTHWELIELTNKTKTMSVIEKMYEIQRLLQDIKSLNQLILNSYSKYKVIPDFKEVLN
jgi:hypothetical protein